LLTNTDWNLIRTCPTPLWLTKAQDLSKTPTIVAAIDPTHEHDKPASLDDYILGLTTMLASKTGATMHAFHSFDPRIALATATANAYIPASLPYEEIEKDMRELHGRRFDEVTGFYDIPEDHKHLISGATHEELPEIARKLKADVIVMGAIARNRWKRLFVGATAERTLEHVPCDLLIVKPDWFETPVEQTGDEAAA
jgi:universal stress protein E